jgi:hypothetical protein
MLRPTAVGQCMGSGYPLGPALGVPGYRSRPARAGPTPRPKETTLTHANPNAANGRNPNAAGLAAQPGLIVLPDQPERWTAHGREPLTWDQARERVAAADREDGERADVAIGDLSSYVVGPGDGGVASLAAIPVPGRPSAAQIPMRRGAFRHLAAAVKAPPEYLLSLPAKLATACLSTGLQRLDPSNTSKLLRLANGEARAIASERYAPLDNALVLDTAERTLRAMGMLGDVRVTDLAVGPTLSMRLVMPGETTPVRAGDVISTGFDLLNGEVLNRSVSITPVTHRLICLNGMRRWDSGAAKRWNHVGDPERLRQAFTDALPVALAEAQGLRQRMAAAVDMLIDDALGEVHGLSAFGFSGTETRTIARDLYADRGVALPNAIDDWTDVVRGTPVTVYDVANAITHAAQARGVDDRLTWEERGGAYLTRSTR